MDGQKWKQQLDPGDNSFGVDGTFGDVTSVAVGKGLFVASHRFGVVYSEDGLDWYDGVVSGLEGTNYITSIAFGEGVFLAISSDGKVLKSEDGNQWAVLHSDLPSIYDTEISYINKQFVLQSSSYSFSLRKTTKSLYIFNNKGSSYELVNDDFNLDYVLEASVNGVYVIRDKSTGGIYRSSSLDGPWSAIDGN